MSTTRVKHLHQEKILEYFAQLNDFIINDAEEEIVAILNRGISMYGEDIIPLLDIRVTMTSDVIQYNCSLLFYAAMRNFQKLAGLLIKCGVSIDEGTRCQTNSSYEKKSPLSAACEMQHIDMVKLLLENKASVLHKDKTGTDIMTRFYRDAAPPLQHLLLKYSLKQRYWHSYIENVLQTNPSIGEVERIKDTMQVMLQEEDFDILFELLNERKEEPAIYALKEYVSKYGIAALNKIQKEQDGHTINFSILYYAIEKNLKNFVLQLLEYGFPIEDGTSCQTKDSLDKNSPLYGACELGHKDIIEILLNRKADLLTQNGRGSSVLMVTKNVEIFQLILEAAKREGCFDKLLKMVNKDGICAYKAAISNGRTDLVAELMKINNYPTFIDVRSFLAFARSAYWRYPEKRDEIEAICTALKQLVDPSYPAKSLDKDAKNYPKPLAYLELFGLNSATRQTRSAAIKDIIAEYYALLKSPKDCMEFFKHFSEEISRYFQEKKQELGTLHPDSYEWRIINGLYFPIPKDNYEELNSGFKSKGSALQELLILLLRNQEAGLAQNAYKWIGYAPKKFADEGVKNGDMITEGRLGNNLFHNKIAHQLQLIPLFYAIQAGKLKLEFMNEKGDIEKITIKELMQALVTFKVFNSDSGFDLWMPVRDTRNISSLVFSDPHRLGSVLMYEGPNFGIHALSTYLKSTFCKGFLQLYHAYRQQPAFSEMSIDDFVNKLNDMQLALFSPEPYLVKLSLFNVPKHSREVVKSGKNYAIVRKEYHPLSDFKLTPFRM